MTQLTVIGMDPSLRNWGLSRCTYDTDTQQLTVRDILTISIPVLPKTDKRPKYTKDSIVTAELFRQVFEFVKGADLICAEMPFGTQNAQGMFAYGACITIVSVISHLHIPIIQISPLESKKTTGDKEASKRQVVEWVQARNPETPFPKYKRNGEWLVSIEASEHAADSILAIYTAMQTNSFKEIIGDLQTSIPLKSSA